MNFHQIYEAFHRMQAAKDARIDREVAQRLYDMAQRERQLDFVAGAYPVFHVPPMHASYERSVRRLWRQPVEPLVTPDVAVHLEEWFLR